MLRKLKGYLNTRFYQIVRKVVRLRHFLYAYISLCIRNRTQHRANLWFLGVVKAIKVILRMRMRNDLGVHFKELCPAQFLCGQLIY